MVNMTKLLLPDEFDPNGHCRTCNYTFKTTTHYRQYLKRYHNVELTPLGPTLNPNISPDHNNTNNHCDSCNWTFSSRSTYWTHLEAVHKMIIPDEGRATLPNANILIDIDDPKLFCKPCQVKYKTLNSFRGHLQRIHKMELIPLSKKPVLDPTISVQDVENADNASCTICKFTYSCKRTYQRHMKYVHKNGKKTTPIHRIKNRINLNIQPDPNDLNFYCPSCQLQYLSRHSYRAHIRKFHPTIKLETKKISSGISPIIAEIDAGNDRNTRCTICDRGYKSRRRYKYHMKVYHKNGKREPVGSTRRKSIPNPNVIPKWDDPANHCRSCSKSYSTKGNYQTHIKKIHSDVLQAAKQLSTSLSGPSL